jgi:hypothetical protein
VFIVIRNWKSDESPTEERAVEPLTITKIIIIREIFKIQCSPTFIRNIIISEDGVYVCGPVIWDIEFPRPDNLNCL